MELSPFGMRSMLATKIEFMIYRFPSARSLHCNCKQGLMDLSRLRNTYSFGADCFTITHAYHQLVGSSIPKHNRRSTDYSIDCRLPFTVATNQKTFNNLTIGGCRLQDACRHGRTESSGDRAFSHTGNQPDKNTAFVQSCTCSPSISADMLNIFCATQICDLV